jgi:hypothetical protein
LTFFHTASARVSNEQLSVLDREHVDVDAFVLEESLDVIEESAFEGSVELLDYVDSEDHRPRHLP